MGWDDVKVVEAEADTSIRVGQREPAAAADIHAHLAAGDPDPELSRRALEDHPLDLALDHVAICRAVVVDDREVLRTKVRDDGIADRDRQATSTGARQLPAPNLEPVLARPDP